VEKTIFVNGTFDILHTGHLKLLNFASSLGDQLIVAIDSDRRVKEKKGSSRPVNNQHERKFMLENIKAVSKVAIFDSDDELRELVRFYNPWVMVVGDDYRDKPVIGSEFANSLLFFRKLDDYSTTKKIQSIAGR
jgi:D-beta-D-heptose 7-phosphate kinase/D-beta-D-heptose 1-phosphate adenosyltransferase